MANALYDSGRNAFLTAGIDWVNNDIRVALLTSAYTFSASHNFVSDLGANIVARLTSTLTTKTAVAGVADADDAVFTAVTGSSVAKFAVYKYNASDSAAQLIAYYDTASSGLPVTPNGGNITIVWDNSTNKVFKL